MGQVVYVDLFFMINFSMDFLCFFLTSQLLSLRLLLGRTVGAAALGGIYACAVLFMPTVVGIAEILLDIFVCIIMCLLAFGRKRIVGNSCVYIATSAVLGGFMTALFALLNKADLPLSSVEGDGISVWGFALLALAGALVSLLGGRFFKKKTVRREIGVYIELDGKSVRLSGLCDSGNLLCEPISGRACIVADIERMSTVLPPKLILAAKNGDVSALTDCRGLVGKTHIIPAKTATGSGLMIAFRPDTVRLGEAGKECEVDALVALAPLDGCDALVPSVLV